MRGVVIRGIERPANCAFSARCGDFPTRKADSMYFTFMAVRTGVSVNLVCMMTGKSTRPVLHIADDMRPLRRSAQGSGMNTPMVLVPVVPKECW